MNKFFLIAVAMMAVIGFTSTASADGFRFGFTTNNGQSIYFSINGDSANYHQVQPRAQHSGYYSHYAPTNNRPNVTKRLRGDGEPISAGQYCPYRMEYYSGRYYCVR